MMQQPSPKLTIADYVMVGLIFVHYLVYEIVWFFYFNQGPIGATVLVWKSVFPAVLAIYSGAQLGPALGRVAQLRFFNFCFMAFLGWAVLPCLLSSSQSGAIVEWFKLGPRLMFWIGLAGLVFAKPATFYLLARLIVVWGLLSVAQFVALIWSGAYNAPILLPGMGDIRFAGPYGLLGNITSATRFPNLPLPVVRLCGLWNEPSNASASLFAGFFLARTLAIVTGRRWWRNVAWILFAGGLLCFSNAGFFALSLALLFGSVMSGKAGWLQWIARIGVSVVAFGLLFLGIFGRAFVMERMPNNELARAMVGLRADVEEVRAGTVDASGGRLQLAALSLEIVARKPIGIGLVTPEDAATETLSASAPILWLTTTGIVGLLLLLLREGSLLWAAISHARLSQTLVLLCQAWIVVCVQHASYGSWMNPLYFIVVAGAFLGIQEVRMSRTMWMGGKGARGFSPSEGRKWSPSPRGRQELERDSRHRRI
jgi:hypothetical protein